MAAKTRAIIVLVLSIMFLLAACSNNNPTVQPPVQNPAVQPSAPFPPPPPPSAIEPQREALPAEPAGSVTVEITPAGFSPQLLTIPSGTTVMFVNNDVDQRWPASDAHPVHADYPGSSIGKCNTPEQDSIFDACKGLAKGESFRFAFTEKGSWNYHDHLDAETGGTIVVE